MNAKFRVLPAAGVAALAATLAACAVPGPYAPGNYPASTTASVEYGRITNVALVSNGTLYRIWVQTDSGVMRAFDVSSPGNLRPGDRVRIENGMIYFA